MRRTRAMAVAAIVWAVGNTLWIGAQAPAPWVLVLPADNQTGNASLDPIGTTVADTISLTLRLLGDFEVRELPAEEIPAAVLRGNLSALRSFSTQQTMDYIVFGSVRSSGDGFDIDAAVWDRGAGAVTVQESGRADSLFDTFGIADQLAVEFLSAFSGQRIAFGEIRVTRQGWQAGQYRVLVDGMEVARNAAVISSVLVGERTVVVEALTGPQTGEVLLEVPINVREGGVSSLSFTMAEPIGGVAAADAATTDGATIDEAPVAESDAVDPDGESAGGGAESPAPSGEREARVGRVAPANRDRPVDFYAGLAYLAWRRDFNGRGSPGLAFDLWFDAAWRQGLELSGSVFIVPEPGGQTYSNFTDGSAALATDAYDTEAESAVAVEATVGWRVYETPIGGAARLEVVPYAGLIYRYQWYFLRHTDGVSEGELVDVTFSSDQEWAYQHYVGFLGGVRARAVIGRFVARVGVGADFNTAIGQAANGRELFVLDESGNYTASGRSLSGVPESGVSWRGSFGVGLGF